MDIKHTVMHWHFNSLGAFFRSSCVHDCVLDAQINLCLSSNTILGNIVQAPKWSGFHRIEHITSISRCCLQGLYGMVEPVIECTPSDGKDANLKYLITALSKAWNK